MEYGIPGPFDDLTIDLYREVLPCPFLRGRGGASLRFGLFVAHRGVSGHRLRRSGYKGRKRALDVALSVSIDEKRPHVFVAAKVEYLLKVYAVSLC